MADKPSLPKGTRDFEPEVMLRREYLFQTIRTVFRKYGYAPLETPAMEQLSVLTGKYGEEGDRLIFRILNNGNFLEGVSPEALADASVLGPQICERALRYDLTVPFARFVVMNQGSLAFPFKRYQIQPVWRADRPQKGRYREFYQCDADAVGADSLLFEAEFIAMYDEALSRLGMDDFTIRINHRQILTAYATAIGHPDQVVTMTIAIDKLDKIGEKGVREELYRRGFTEEEADKLFSLITFEGDTMAKLDFLEKELGHLDAGKTGVSELREVFRLYQHQSKFKGKVSLDLTLARGLDYYTGTVFEVKVNNVEMGSIGGGGRYADLTGVFGVPGLSGVGISFGADRIYDVLQALNLFENVGLSPVKVLVPNFGEETLEAGLNAVRQLREAGVSAEMYPDDSKLKKQFAYANKKGVPFLLMIGAEEAAKGVCQLKDMVSGQQETITLVEAIEKLASAKG